MAETIERLKNKYRSLTTLHSITGAYSDVSSFKIKTLKKSYDQNILFYEQVTQIYHSIRISAMFKRARKNKVVSDRPLQPKTLHVALTSNKRFYGSLNKDIMDRVNERIMKTRDNRMIIGLTGIDFVRTLNDRAPYESLVFQADQPTQGEIMGLMNAFKSYDRVFVYYPKFVNMLTQSVARIDITYSPTSSVLPRHEIKYIFEPELPKILEFFKDQIRSILFSRVILETELARTAKRLVSMDSAEKRALDMMIETNLQIESEKKAVINRELIESIIRIKRR